MCKYRTNSSRHPTEGSCWHARAKSVQDDALKVGAQELYASVREVDGAGHLVRMMRFMVLCVLFNNLF